MPAKTMNVNCKRDERFFYVVVDVIWKKFLSAD